MNTRPWTFSILFLVFLSFNHHATGVRIFYIIGNMANDLPQVEKFLAEGANGVAVDVQFSLDGRPTRTSHGFPCSCFRNCFTSDIFRHVLEHFRDITTPEVSGNSDVKLSLIFLNLRVQFLGGGALYTAGKRLGEALLMYYFEGGLSGANGWVVLSVPTIRHALLFQGVKDVFQEHEASSVLDQIGFDIGSNEPMLGIYDAFISLGITEHRWVGDGVSNCLIRSTDRLEALLDERDTGEARFSRVYHWTIDSPPNMRTSLRLGVDAIITNRPDRLLTVLEEDEFYGKYRLATPEDRPWSRVIQGGVSLPSSSIDFDIPSPSTGLTNPDSLTISSPGEADLTKDNAETSNDCTKSSSSATDDEVSSLSLALTSDDVTTESSTTTIQSSSDISETKDLDIKLPDDDVSSKDISKLMDLLKGRTTEEHRPYKKSLFQNEDLVDAIRKISDRSSTSNSESDGELTKVLVDLLKNVNTPAPSSSVPVDVLMALLASQAPPPSPSVPLELAAYLLRPPQPNPTTQLLDLLRPSYGSSSVPIDTLRLLLELQSRSPQTSFPLSLLQPSTNYGSNSALVSLLLSSLQSKSSSVPLNTLLPLVQLLNSRSGSTDLSKVLSSLTSTSKDTKVQKNDESKKANSSNGKQQTGRELDEIKPSSDSDKDGSKAAGDNTKQSTFKPKGRDANCARNITKNFPLPSELDPAFHPPWQPPPSTMVLADIGPDGVHWNVWEKPGNVLVPPGYGPVSGNPFFPGNVLKTPRGQTTKDKQNKDAGIKLLSSGFVPNVMPIQLPLRPFGRPPFQGSGPLQFGPPRLPPVGYKRPGFHPGIPPRPIPRPRPRPFPRPCPYPGAVGCGHNTHSYASSNYGPVSDNSHSYESVNYGSVSDIIKYPTGKGIPESYYSYKTKGLAGNSHDHRILPPFPIGSVYKPPVYQEPGVLLHIPSHATKSNIGGANSLKTTLINSGNNDHKISLPGSKDNNTPGTNATLDFIDSQLDVGKLTDDTTDTKSSQSGTIDDIMDLLITKTPTTEATPTIDPDESVIPTLEQLHNKENLAAILDSLTSSTEKLTEVTTQMTNDDEILLDSIGTTTTSSVDKDKLLPQEEFFSSLLSKPESFSATTTDFPPLSLDDFVSTQSSLHSDLAAQLAILSGKWPVEISVNEKPATSTSDTTQAQVEISSDDTPTFAFDVENTPPNPSKDVNTGQVDSTFPRRNETLLPPTGGLGWNGNALDLKKLQELLSEHTGKRMEVIIIENTPLIFVPSTVSGASDQQLTKLKDLGEKLIDTTMSPSFDIADQHTTTRKREATFSPLDVDDNDPNADDSPTMSHSFPTTKKPEHRVPVHKAPVDVTISNPSQFLLNQKHIVSAVQKVEGAKEILSESNPIKKDQQITPESHTMSSLRNEETGKGVSEILNESIPSQEDQSKRLESDIISALKGEDSDDDSSHIFSETFPIKKYQNKTPESEDDSKIFLPFGLRVNQSVQFMHTSSVSSEGRPSITDGHKQELIKQIDTDESPNTQQSQESLAHDISEETSARPLFSSLIFDSQEELMAETTLTPILNTEHKPSTHTAINGTHKQTLLQHMANDDINEQLPAFNKFLPLRTGGIHMPVGPFHSLTTHSSNSSVTSILHNESFSTRGNTHGSNPISVNKGALVATHNETRNLTTSFTQQHIPHKIKYNHLNLPLTEPGTESRPQHMLLHSEKPVGSTALNEEEIIKTENHNLPLLEDLEPQHPSSFETSKGNGAMDNPQPEIKDLKGNKPSSPIKNEDFLEFDNSTQIVKLPPQKVQQQTFVEDPVHIVLEKPQQTKTQSLNSMQLEGSTVNEPGVSLYETPQQNHQQSLLINSDFTVISKLQDQPESFNFDENEDSTALQDESKKFSPTAHIQNSQANPSFVQQPTLQTNIDYPMEQSKPLQPVSEIRENQKAIGQQLPDEKHLFMSELLQTYNDYKTSQDESKLSLNDNNSKQTISISETKDSHKDVAPTDQLPNLTVYSGEVVYPIHHSTGNSSFLSSTTRSHEKNTSSLSVFQATDGEFLTKMKTTMKNNKVPYAVTNRSLETKLYSNLYKQKEQDELDHINSVNASPANSHIVLTTLKTATSNQYSPEKTNSHISSDEPPLNASDSLIQDTKVQQNEKALLFLTKFAENSGILPSANLGLQASMLLNLNTNPLDEIDDGLQTSKHISTHSTESNVNSILSVHDKYYMQTRSNLTTVSNPYTTVDPKHESHLNRMPKIQALNDGNLRVTVQASESTSNDISQDFLKSNLPLENNPPSNELSSVNANANTLHIPYALLETTTLEHYLAEPVSINTETSDEVTTELRNFGPSRALSTSLDLEDIPKDNVERFTLRTVSIIDSLAPNIKAVTDSSLAQILHTAPELGKLEPESKFINSAFYVNHSPQYFAGNYDNELLKQSSLVEGSSVASDPTILSTDLSDANLVPKFHDSLIDSSLDLNSFVSQLSAQLDNSSSAPVAPVPTNHRTISKPKPQPNNTSILQETSKFKINPIEALPSKTIVDEERHHQILATVNITSKAHFQTDDKHNIPDLPFHDNLRMQNSWKEFSLNKATEVLMLDKQSASHCPCQSTVGVSTILKNTKLPVIDETPLDDLFTNLDVEMGLKIQATVPSFEAPSTFDLESIAILSDHSEFKTKQIKATVQPIKSISEPYKPSTNPVKDLNNNADVHDHLFDDVSSSSRKEIFIESLSHYKPIQPVKPSAFSALDDVPSVMNLDHDLTASFSTEGFSNTGAVSNSIQFKSEARFPEHNPISDSTKCTKAHPNYPSASTNAAAFLPQIHYFNSDNEHKITSLSVNQQYPPLPNTRTPQEDNRQLTTVFTQPTEIADVHLETRTPIESLLREGVLDIHEPLSTSMMGNITHIINNGGKHTSNKANITTNEEIPVVQSAIVNDQLLNYSSTKVKSSTNASAVQHTSFKTEMQSSVQASTIEQFKSQVLNAVNHSNHDVTHHSHPLATDSPLKNQRPHVVSLRVPVPRPPIPFLRRPVLKPTHSSRTNRNSSFVGSHNQFPLFARVQPAHVSIQHKGSATPPSIRPNSMTPPGTHKQHFSSGLRSWSSAQLQFLRNITHSQPLSDSVTHKQVSSPVLYPDKPHTLVTIQPALHPGINIYHAKNGPFRSTHNLDRSQNGYLSVIDIPGPTNQPGYSITVKSVHEARDSDRHASRHQKTVSSQTLEIERMRKDARRRMGTVDTEDPESSGRVRFSDSRPQFIPRSQPVPRGRTHSPQAVRKFHRVVASQQPRVSSKNLRSPAPSLPQVPVASNSPGNHGVSSQVTNTRHEMQEFRTGSEKSTNSKSVLSDANMSVIRHPQMQLRHVPNPSQQKRTSYLMPDNERGYSNWRRQSSRSSHTDNGHTKRRL